MKKLFFILFRLLFGLSIVSLGVFHLTNVNKNEHRISTNLESTFNVLKLPKNILTMVKSYSNIIAYLEAFLLIMTGLLTAFRKCGAGFYIFLGIVIHLTLINNPVLNKDINNAVKLISIFGGVLLN
jgi:hypothetical protein